MPHPGLLHPERLPLQRATADPDLLRRHSDTVLAQSLQPLGSGVHKGNIIKSNLLDYSEN